MMMMMIVPQIPFHFPSFLLLLHSLFFLHRLLSLFFSYPANTISFRSFHWIERIETKVINKNNYKMKTMINTRISRFQFDLTSFFLLIFSCNRHVYELFVQMHDGIRNLSKHLELIDWASSFNLKDGVLVRLLKLSFCKLT